MLSSEYRPSSELAGWQVFWHRSQSILLNQPRHLLDLALAIPMVITALLLIAIGYLITWLRPRTLLTAYNHLLVTAKSITSDLKPSVFTSTGHHLF